MSGTATKKVVQTLTGKPPGRPRSAQIRQFRGHGKVGLIDIGLLIWFPGPGSFTGEDVAEFQVHGGPSVVRALLESIGQVSGCREAGAGEFTKRAFVGGKLDLAQVEGSADLVAAETEGQRKQAVRQLNGALGTQCENWRRALIDNLGRVEATLEFPDEGVPDSVLGAALGGVEDTLVSMQKVLQGAAIGERVRNGVDVALVGPPNVGKSSIINRLAGREAAIVSAKKGTTRDVVEVRLDVQGFAVTVSDTAGLRDDGDEGDEVERQGIRRAAERAKSSDLVVAVYDARDWPQRDEKTSSVISGDYMEVFNKADLVDGSEPRPGEFISAVTGQGFRGFESFLGDKVKGLMSEGYGEAAIVTRERHRRALQEVCAALDRACNQREPELLAEDLRLAMRALGRITGLVGVEKVLDSLFREFCIGK